MPWGDVSNDDRTPGATAERHKRLRFDHTAACSGQGTWEAVLEARKRPRHAQSSTSPAACVGVRPISASTEWSGRMGGTPHSHLPTPPPSWGEFAGCEGVLRGSLGNFAVELQLGEKEVLRVDDGRKLASVSSTVSRHLFEARFEAGVNGGALRFVDLSSSGCQPQALRMVVRRMVRPARDTQATSMQDGARCKDADGFWRSNVLPRAVARGASDNTEARAVEDAIHVMELMRAAHFLGLEDLEREAESQLLEYQGVMHGGERGTARLRGGDAVVMPLFAICFGHGFRQISAACLHRLTKDGAAILLGRERQLGVLYATHPVAAAALSGILKAACDDGRRDKALGAARVDPIVVDLLYGQTKNSAALISSTPQEGGHLQ